MRLVCTSLLLFVAGAALAAETPLPPELSALRREFDKRRADALRPVSTWYETELQRLERSYTIRGNLDGALAVRAEREAMQYEQLTAAQLKARLEGTRWQWNGSSPQEITFKKDGTLECAEWAKQGYALTWEAIDGHTASYRVIRGPMNIGRDVVLKFAPDLSTFSGVNTDGQPIKPSPRLK